MSSAIACSGSSEATSVMKSPPPLAAAVSTMLRAFSRRFSRIFSMFRGVKPLEMIRRYFLCSSPSWLMNRNRVISMISRSVPGANRGMAVFSQVEKTSLVRREISLTSACLVTTQ